MPPLPAPPARLRARRRDLAACDASAGIVTTIRDTVSCSWIFYSNSSGSGGVEGAAPPPAEPDPDLDSMHTMLDPHLQPIPPDVNDEESMRIFEEHKQLAQEYLKMQTKIAYMSKHNSELCKRMEEPELEKKREFIQFENEKDSLIKLYCSLKKQLPRSDDWLLSGDSPHE